MSAESRPPFSDIVLTLEGMEREEDRENPIALGKKIEKNSFYECLFFYSSVSLVAHAGLDCLFLDYSDPIFDLKRQRSVGGGMGVKSFMGIK